MLIYLIGKHECKVLRMLVSDNNAVMTEHSYSEALKADFDMKIQSEAFGFKLNISIEGSSYEYHNKDHNDESNQ